MKVTIRKDRMLLCDGRPFFPLQARHMPVGATIKDLAGAGFNCIRHLVFGAQHMPAQPRPADLHGLKVCAYLFNRANLRADPDHRAALAGAVRALRDDPDLLAYENCNEPAWRPDLPDVVHHAAADLAAGYRLVKRLDPHHPVHQGHSCAGTVEALREYNACADIIGCNPYPVLPSRMRRHMGIRADGRALDSPDQSLAAVGDYTRKMRDVGERRKPVWMQLQAMAWEDFYGPVTEGGPRGPDPAVILYPTYAQIRYMAFADIISGATGLLFSMWRVPVAAPVWADIRRLAAELHELHDVLAGQSAALPLQARYRNLGFTIWKGVGVRVKKAHGNLYLLAANHAFDSAEVTWSGFERTKASTLRVLGEDRKIKIVHGGATDRFEPYAARVYRLE